MEQEIRNLSSIHLVRRIAGNPVARWTAALFWTAPATYLMVWPSRGTPVGRLSLLFGGTEFTDAIGHVILLSILVWLWYQALCGHLQPFRALGVAATIGLGMGVATELAQAFVPSRGASVLDLLANGLGVGLAAGAAAVRQWRND